MRRKRGNSEGSIYKMADGRWRAAITTGSTTDDSGKKIPRRRVFTGQTRHEVAEQRGCIKICVNVLRIR